MNKIYKKVGNEVWVIPCGEPPQTQFLKESKPTIPHSEEPINRANLIKLSQMKQNMLKSVDLWPAQNNFIIS